MPYLNISAILQLTAAVVGLELAFFAALLMHRRLFHWTSAGFWAWASFLLYFVLSPWAVSVSDFPLYRANLILELSGGIERASWILLVVIMGIAAFFLSYLRTSFKPITWRLPPGPIKLNPPTAIILFAFVVFGMYSLLVFRAGLFSIEGEKLIVNGRFVGNITGYQNGAYAFLFVPIFLLFLSDKKRLQVIGVIAAAIFLILSLPHAWSRFATVSFLLALSMIVVVKKGRAWPSVVWIIGILLVATLYQLRGHTDWRYGQISHEIVDLVESLPSRTNQILSSSDTSMLQVWYMSSYLNDRWNGFDYGLPVLNYALTGWIPSRIFPDKYFLIDWLVSQKSQIYPAILDQLLYGAKSSMPGTFYEHGGLIGVLIGCLLAGFLSRRLDGMLIQESSTLVKSVAIAWMSILWMVWASGTAWSMMAMGIMALPSLVSWLFLSKVPSGQGREARSLSIPPDQAYSLEK